MSSEPRSIWYAIGPGILFAGAAVGVSHLIQSTRAGASYGLALIPIVIIANAMKYPAFRFGPQYAAATGCSLLQGYRNQGRWALGLYLLLTLGTMFTVQAAVTVVTAGLLLSLTGWAMHPALASAGLLAVCIGLLIVGRYQWLDRVVKAAVGIFTVATVVATVLALPKVDWGGSWMLDLGTLTLPQALFVAALIGWMPSAIDVAVWQSLWTLARSQDSGRLPSPKDAIVDFHVGYLGTALLALCFLLMGAAVLHGSGVELADRPPAFAGQLIDMYAQNLGAWSRPVVAISALLVMFSTTLTVVDGFPRALSHLQQRFSSDETPVEPQASEKEQPDRSYWAAVAIISLGAVLLLALAMASLKGLVDLATTLSFLTAPLLSILNHRAILGPEVPPEGRPSTPLKIASLVAIVAQLAFAGYYLWLRFGA